MRKNTQKQAIVHHKHIKVYVKHSKPFINKVKIFLYIFFDVNICQHFKVGVLPTLTLAFVSIRDEVITNEVITNEVGVSAAWIPFQF